MRPKVFVLGAGVYQVPLIRRARQMGVETIVVTPPGDYPGIPLADVLLELDTTDTREIVSAAKEYAISGIVTTGSDAGVPTIGAVVEALGLRGPTRAMAAAVSAKTAFRAFQKENGLNLPGFAACRSAQDTWDFFRTTTTGVVVKPDDASGSRGVTILTREQAQSDVVAAYRTAFEFSRNGRVCAEAFLDGKEVGGDAFLVNGEAAHLWITCKHMQGVIVRGHSLPGNLSEREFSIVKDEIERAAVKLGYADGPLNFDVMLEGSSATILEMGLRNGGNGILDLVRYCHGIDLTEWLLCHVLGRPIQDVAFSEPKPVSSYVFGTQVAGVLVSVPSLPAVQQRVPRVFEIVLAKKPGDSVAPLVHNANLIGYLLLRCGAEEYQAVTSGVDDALLVEVTT